MINHRLNRIARNIVSTYGSWSQNRETGDFAEQAWQEYKDAYILGQDLVIDELQVNGQNIIQEGDKITLVNDIELRAHLQMDWSQPFGFKCEVIDFNNVHSDGEILFYSDKYGETINNKIKNDDTIYINGSFIKAWTGLKKNIKHCLDNFYYDDNIKLRGLDINE